MTQSKIILIFTIKNNKVWKWKLLSRVRLFATPWTIQSMGFSRPKYWSGQPFPSPGDLPNPGSEPRSLALQADSLPPEPQGKPNKVYIHKTYVHIYLFQKQDHCSYNIIILERKHRLNDSETEALTIKAKVAEDNVRQEKTSCPGKEKPDTPGTHFQGNKEQGDLGPVLASWP